MCWPPRQAIVRINLNNVFLSFAQLCICFVSLFFRRWSGHCGVVLASSLNRFPCSPLDTPLCWVKQNSDIFFGFPTNSCLFFTFFSPLVRPSWYGARFFSESIYLFAPRQAIVLIKHNNEIFFEFSTHFLSFVFFVCPWSRHRGVVLAFFWNDLFSRHPRSHCVDETEQWKISECSTNSSSFFCFSKSALGHTTSVSCSLLFWIAVSSPPDKQFCW